MTDHIGGATARTLTRRGALALGGLGLAGLAVGSWPRLTAQDIPGRGDDSMTIAILGTRADAEARQALVDAFRAEYPGIKVRIQPVQGTDWKDFFAKILTMVAAGDPPDVVYVATEGAQLFADKLAEPLDDYIRRDAAELQDYFDDVHPSLLEAFMYQGSLYQLPLDWNAANMYLNMSTLEEAGLSLPAADWTHDDFASVMRQMKSAQGSGFTPYYWTNRLFGGVVPWLYTNDTSFLTEEKAPGGDWFWDRFYPGDPARATRGGGYVWDGANATDERVFETFDFLRELVAEGLGVRPEGGGGESLVGLFANGRIGAAPAGGYWVQGLHEAGMAEDGFNVQFFPRNRTQRHQFGAAGYAIMSTARNKDAAWEWVKFCSRRESMELAFPTPNTTPTRRSMVNAAFYSETGPKNWQVFYDTLDKFPTSGPIPAPPAQAAVETALMKHVPNAVSGSSRQTRATLANLQSDLERVLRSEQ
ncbi:extracellular solute-binding protein [Zhihengliuella sp.]|uniref:extracellular solute-binding protein n=1 Tax=Zhihengliuella sp. TaxID=1954483 RepID=UPI00281255DD|nr:extracellular solute-binding protein [Zhihengliuella sp.]